MPTVADNHYDQYQVADAIYQVAWQKFDTARKDYAAYRCDDAIFMAALHEFKAAFAAIEAVDAATQN